jgi:hypothetical protein
VETVEKINEVAEVPEVIETPVLSKTKSKMKKRHVKH